MSASEQLGRSWLLCSVRDFTPTLTGLVASLTGYLCQLTEPADFMRMGQAGLSGKVNRHFWERYGGAILLTTVGGIASSLGGGSTVVLSTTTDGSGAAAALQSSAKISPTIRVPQGTPIQVFVAKDLDFSETGS